MEPSEVSVVVVSYNTIDKLRQCLACIEPEHEVIVVDNASIDGSAEMVRSAFPHVKLIENSGNIGFGAANNQGVDLATRPLVLFLNSDCYARPGSIAKLAKHFDDLEVVAAGGTLYNPDGSLQSSAAAPLTLWAVFCEQTGLERLHIGGYWLSSSIRDRVGKPTQVAQVMGACLLMRPVERFDERYFLYCEDTDLCKRLSRHGKILYDPDAPFTHELGSSSVGASRWLSVARYNRGKELYFSIHHGAFSSLACFLLDRMGALLRLIAYVVATIFTLGRYRQRVALWARVLTVSPRGPDRPPRKSG